MILECIDICKTYVQGTLEFPILKNVNFSMEEGEYVSCMGPSGSGKSTLMNIIGCLDSLTSGRLILDGQDISNCTENELADIRLKKIGFIFQNFQLLSYQSAAANVELPLTYAGVPRAQRREIAQEALAKVGLADRMDFLPNQLSGGQKQRVAIARTLAMDPEVIMLDEPTSALDPTMVGEVEAVISELANLGKTMLIVTHEMNFARSISNRVFYMDEGGIYEDGTPEKIFDHPEKENTRRFVKKLKVLTLDIGSRNYDFLSTATQIETYCNRNKIDHAYGKRILLVFEETSQLLIDSINDPCFKAVFEYSEKEESGSWTFNYAGSKTDITKSGDDLSIKVLKGICDKIEYSFDEGSELPDQLYLKVRNN